MKPIAEEKIAMPALDVIRLLHRADGSYASFNAIIGRQYENLFAIRSDDLPVRFADVRPYLARDAFFSVNAFYGAWGKSRVFPGLPAMCRHARNVSHFNACFVDVDCGNAGITTEDVLVAIEDMQRGGAMPPVSIVAESGRGVWFFWLLCDAEDRSKPPRARNQNIAAYGRIQRALKERLARFAPDAIDAVRTVRVPGSINGKNGATVCYRVTPDASGEVVSYTIAQLAAFLNVRRRKIAGGEAASAELKDLAKQKAHRAMQARRLRQFEKLRAIRSGFSEGCRNRAALLYVLLLRANDVTAVEIEHELEQLAAECYPRLRRSECRDALAGARKPRWLKDQTIADWLLIAPDEAAQLEGWPAASWHRTAALPKSSRADLTTARRKLIVSLYSDLGGALPSLRQMQALLLERGHRTGRGTIANDYTALGLGRELWASTNRQQRVRSSKMVSNFVHIGRLLTRAPEGVDCNENKGFNEAVR